MTLKSFQDVERELAKYIAEQRNVTGKNNTVERMRPLMKLVGNPEQRLKIVHIAGTSGKTSTAYYIAALLKASGKKVGLMVSPHIVSMNERVQINLGPLPETLFCQEFSRFLDLVKDLKPIPTYFELLTAFAYWYFAKLGVDYAVIETGMGGLHDATNVAQETNKICVITDIGMDHMQILGNELTDIAHQKAGIIHKNNQVFMYEQASDVMRVVKAVAQENKATLNVLTKKETTPAGLKRLPNYQQRNWKLAHRVFEFVAQRDALRVLSGAQLTATAETYIPGRMDVRQQEGKSIVLDGAHNGQKMAAFVASYQARYTNQKAAVLLGLKSGKDYQAVLPLLRPICQKLIVTELTKDSLPSGALAEAARGQGFSEVVDEPDYKKAFQLLLETDRPLLVVTGSLYLVGDVLQLLSASSG